MPKVRRADGSVVEMSMAEIESVNNSSIVSQVTQPPTARQAVSEGAINTVLDNVLGLPSVVGDVAGRGIGQLAAGARTIGAAPRLAMQGDSIPDFFNQAVQQEEGRGVAAGLQNIPSPTSLDVRAAMDPDRTRDQVTEQMLGLQQQFPNAFGGGELLGDALTLGAGRAGIARNLRSARPSPTATPPLRPNPRPGFTAGIKQEVDAIVNGPIVKSLRRGGLRVGETGLEGATLALLNENDPVATAMYAAGTQAAGSTILTLADVGFGRRGKNLVLTAAATTALIQMFKTATPGGRDRILESTETAFDKIMAGLALGILTGAAGLGRPSNTVRDRIPEIADGLTSIPRGVVLSLLSDLSDPNRGQEAEITAQVLNKMSTDPKFFGPTAQRLLVRASEGNGPGLTETVQRLMKDRAFRRKLDELPPTESISNVPDTQVDPRVIEAADKTLATLESPNGPQPQNAINPAGLVPDAAIDAAIANAQTTSVEQAGTNAQNALAAQTANAMLNAVDASSLSSEKKKAIRDIIGDPSQATPELLMQVQELLRNAN